MKRVTRLTDSCPYCKGTGSYVAIVDPAAGPEDVKCTVCGGRGRLYTMAASAARQRAFAAKRGAR